MVNFSADKKRLISNFFSLSSVEVANYIFPLITLPYLVRVLGPERFGLIAFAQAFVQYFVLLTDYGFNLTAAQDISVHREDMQKVSKIFSSVIMIKIVLMILSFALMAVLISAIPKFRQDWLIYIYAFGMVIGDILFPIWFFQGMEKMKFIAALNFISKLVFLIAIFVFVKKQADYIYVPLITSLGYIFAGVLSLIIARTRFKIRLHIPKLSDISRELKEGWHIFISTAAVSLYTTSNTFILGLLTNNTFVGYYNAAERLIKSSQRLLNPISQTIYPHISRLVADSKERALTFIKKVLLLVGGGSFVISAGIFILAGPIVNIILGPKYTESIPVLRILAFLPFLIALSNVFGIQTMVTFNMKELFSKIVILGGIINIILAFVFVPFFKHIGTASAVLITELYVTVTMFVCLHRKGILKINKILS